MNDTTKHRFGILISLCLWAATAVGGERPNVLLITADDLGYEAVGSLVDDIPDLTPTLDKLAGQGFQFRNAHTNTPICQPSRSNLATGKYAVSSGMMGFFHMKERSPTIMQTLSDHGYITGILGKVKHSTPDLGFRWDFVHDQNELGAGRSPERYYSFSSEFFARSKAEGKPFYFMVNSHDPHRKFHDPENPMTNAATPSALFTPSQVRVPGYLPDLEQTRLELSHYYNSVRRFDDTLAMVLQALDESGLSDNTIVMVLSDNGSAFPFAKANAYLASTRTPWVVRWPGKIADGTTDEDHFVSAIDFFPTVLEAIGICAPESLDGRSFLPILRGGTQEGRTEVYTQIDYKIGGPATPMRAVQDAKYGYIFNPWSREGANYRNSNEGDITAVMEKSDGEEILARLVMFRDRTLEEFYDLENDPDSTRNLIDDPAYARVVDQYRKKLRDWMAEHDDPVLAMLESRDDRREIARLMKKAYPSKAELTPEAQKEQQEKKRKEKARQRKSRRQQDSREPTK